ncbi:MAG: hypothetical protein MRY21_07440 [Simkaniaceae bacterium]|nr:hypothetical protein [Simkaniaceae bacterium]
MPHFIQINDRSQIPTDSSWHDATKFYSYGRVVDTNGRPLTSQYEGRTYRLIGKKEKHNSKSKRIAFLVLTIFLSILTFGAIFRCRSLKNLRAHKIVNRYGLQEAKPIATSTSPQTNKIMREVLLTQGVSVADQMKTHLNQVLNSVLKKESVAGVSQYKSQSDHRVFTIDSIPGHIFKLHIDSTSNDMKDRFSNMLKAVEEIANNKLDLLVVPNAKLFEIQHNGQTYPVLVEKKLTFNPSASGQEQLYEKSGKTLNESVRQLALLISKTGLQDIDFRNIPILKETDDFGLRKIGLIDLEFMNDPTYSAFYGNYYCRDRGLIRCVNLSQVHFLNKFTRNLPINEYSLRSAIRLRKKEIEDNQKLAAFHSKRGIIEGDEPIQINEGDLTFPNYPELEEELKQWALKFIAEINRQIEKSSPNDSKKARRRIQVPLLDEPVNFKEIYSSELPQIDRPFSEVETGMKLDHIIHRFMELGLLYGTVQAPHGMIVQA